MNSFNFTRAKLNASYTKLHKLNNQINQLKSAYLAALTIKHTNHNVINESQLLNIFTQLIETELVMQTAVLEIYNEVFPLEQKPNDQTSSNSIWLNGK